MIRRIIQIDEEKCNGCGLCAKACHEGAIGMVDGKAKLLRDDYCDGLGDCLPACPTGAITFVEREAAAYDEAAVMALRMPRQRLPEHQEQCSGGAFPDSQPAAQFSDPDQTGSCERSLFQECGSVDRCGLYGLFLRQFP